MHQALSCEIFKIHCRPGHIIRDECVLCGECYVVCPQNAKQIRNDVDQVKSLIAAGDDVYVSLAPSYAAWFQSWTAKMWKTHFQSLDFAGYLKPLSVHKLCRSSMKNIINKGGKRIVISSCCHTVNTLIERHFEKALPYLANVVTPMHAHGKMLKKAPGMQSGVCWPCISKRQRQKNIPALWMRFNLWRIRRLAGIRKYFRCPQPFRADKKPYKRLSHLRWNSAQHEPRQRVRLCCGWRNGSLHQRPARHWQRQAF